MSLSKISFLIVTGSFFFVTGLILYLPQNNNIGNNWDLSTSSNVMPANDILSDKTSTDTTPIPSVSNLTPTSVNNRCIIQIDNQKYDVTIFKNRHSGGDIFTCGTDMSTAFHQQHNQRFLDKMMPYKI